MLRKPYVSSAILHSGINCMHTVLHILTATFSDNIFMNEILAININDLSKTEKSWCYLMSCKMIKLFLLCWTISETHTSQPFGLGNCGTCRPRVSWNNWKCKVNRDEDLREERCWCWRCWRRYNWSGGLASQLTGAVLQDPALSPTHRYIASR